MEQYGRRWSIRVYGLEESPQENCKQLVVNTINERLKVNLSINDIEVAHRAGKFTQGKPRSIIARFLNRETRQVILKNRRLLKGSRISISEDLTSQNVKLLNRVSNSDKVEKVWSTNGKIYGLIPHCTTKIQFKLFEKIEDSISKQLK